MTDEQIIQAVDLCANAQEDCRKCPLHSVYSANCIKRLMNITLDLIKRQQARIEQEVDLNREMFEKMARDEAEIKRLEADREALINGQITLQKMYAEAIKKFAEEIINDVLPKCTYGHEETALRISLAIAEKVKELTEGK